MRTNIKYMSAEERRIATIEAVVELAAEQNPSAITTTAIAQRMGLTQGALFRHFPNKEALLQAVMEWVAEQLLSRVDSVLQTATSPLVVLEAAFMTHIGFVTEYPGVPRLLFGELQRAEDTASKRAVQRLIHQYKERLHKVIDQGKACKELDLDLDTEASSVLFIGMIQGLVMQSMLTDGVGRLQRDAPGVFAIYQRGVSRRVQ